MLLKNKVYYKVNQFLYIKESCQLLNQFGIKLCRGETFSWTGFSHQTTLDQEGKTQDVNNKIFIPKTANALGSVLFRNGKEFSITPWSDLEKILNVNSHWLYRFSIGWNQRHILSYAVTNQNGDIVKWSDDDVCIAAKSLSKEMVK